MNLKGIEVEFNFLDAEDMEKFEKEVDIVLKKCEKEEKENHKTSESIKIQCKIIEDFFDNVFGKGISDKIFVKKYNLAEHLEIYADIIKERNVQVDKTENAFGRYKPNREERRYNKYRKNNRGRRY
jgi:gamma-glutamyl:cysteine ligase YbdK (ATP-grasp superfamily)